MKVRINGKAEILSGKSTLSEYLRTKGINKSAVAVELNRQILDKSKYDETYINEADEIEIVHFVGGG